MSGGELNVTRWLEAHCDRNSQVSVLPRCALLIDVLDNGNSQLIITDFSRNLLRTYKHTLIYDINLSDIPNSLITFHSNQMEPKIPGVAVACGPDIFIYKNNKPFFKFHTPSSQISSVESDFWQRISNSLFENITNAIEELDKTSLSLFSGRLQGLICSTSKESFIKKFRNKPLVKDSTITCMCTLKKSSYDKCAISCPVLATESGNVYILDPQTLTIVHQANACGKKSTPYIITSIGLFDVEYKIVIGCREGHICILNRSWVEGKLIAEFIDDIVDIVIVPGDNFIIVASSQKTLSCFTKRGQNLWSAKTASLVTCICLISVCHLNMNLIAVGLRNGMIHLYHGRYLVDSVTLPESPSAIAYGQMGQEENVMVVITLGGTIIYRILKRTATFNVKLKNSIPVLHCKSIPLPKRSKLFLEQSLREKTDAKGTLRFFQQELMKLRIKNASELNSPIKSSENKDLKIEANICGFGSKSAIILILENLNTNICITDLVVMYHTKLAACYSSIKIIKVPILPPFHRYKMKIHIMELNESHQNDVEMWSAKIYVTKCFHLHPELIVTVDLNSPNFV